MSALSRCAILALLVVGSAQVGAQVNDFGVGGILDIPSARMFDEGTLNTTYSRKDIADIYAIAYQPLPRLEAAFRYTIFNAREKSPIVGKPCFQGADYCDIGRDRSFELKYRLVDETELVPAIAVGVRDLVGTGAWGAEYLVASKSVGRLDLTVGVGWGRLAERDVADNPMGYLNDGFRTRPGGDGGLGGRPATRLFFRGERVGIFGGIRYRPTALPVEVVAAYSSDSYARERGFGTVSDTSPLSIGLEWSPSPGVRLGFSRQQGNQWAFSLSASLDTAADPIVKPPNGFGSGDTAPVTSSLAPLDWWLSMANDAEASGLLLRSYALVDEERTLHVRYSNGSFQLEADAVRRVMELAEQYAPLSITSIVATGDWAEMPTHTVKYQRREMTPARLLPPEAVVEVGDVEQSFTPTGTRGFQYPNGAIGLGLDARAYLFDPEFPLLYRLSARLRGEVDFGGGWSGSVIWAQKLQSQFDRITRESQSELPAVRTRLKEYLQQGESGLDELALVYRQKVLDSVYTQTYVGVLEEMYAGVGTEWLWRPFQSPVAIGANLNWVAQRDFDKRLGLQNYNTITGHASVYWASEAHNFDIAVHAGRYLAGDWGATFEVQKRFPNGWSVGAFATFTDVPFSKFGEGSFDKGLIFRIPFDLYSPKNVRGAYRTIIRPINRDGGRMLDNWPGSLWENLRGTHADWLQRHQSRMAPR
jgi:hypothetical protein